MEDHRRLPNRASNNPPSGVYDQDSPTVGPFQYYEPPQSKSSGDNRRSFSERTGGAHQGDALDGASRSDSRRVTDLGITGHLTEPFHEPQSNAQEDDDHARNRSINGNRQAPLRIDPNAVPSNVRDKAWSPDLVSPRIRPRQQQPTIASEPARHGSVSDRSPLQKLEADLSSKEQKRARVEQAEHTARQRSLKKTLSPESDIRRQGNLRSDKERAVSDGARRSEDPARRKDDKSRHASSGQATDGANRGERRTQRAQMSPIAAKSPTQQDYFSSRQRQDDPAAFESNAYQNSPSTSRNLDRSQSLKSPSKSHHSGYGRDSTALVGAPIKRTLTAAERGKIAHERRKSQLIDPSHASPDIPTTPEHSAKSGNRRVQQRQPPLGESYENNDRNAAGESYALRQPLRSHPVGNNVKLENDTPEDASGPTAISRAEAANKKSDPINYRIPPQTAPGQQARQQIAFSTNPAPQLDSKQEKHHRLGDIFHRHGQEPRSYQPNEKALEEWRNAETVRLTAQDLDFDPSAATADKNDPWWAKNKQRSSSIGSNKAPASAPYDGPYEEAAKQFQPTLYTKCGPLLRYTGMRTDGNRSNDSAGREIWRGSVMIVTDDALSDYSPVPTLRLFAQPMDLLTPPPQHLLDSGMELAPEYEDPVAGQVKLSRTGRPLYVRPVHDIDGEVDLSRQENPQGLYAATRTPVLGPQSTTGTDGRPTQHITFQDKSRIKGNDGEKARRFREVKGARLHVERGYTFWRFNLEIELGSTQQRIAYRINHGPAIGFWVPARDQTMNIMFHSCNGFSMSVDPHTFSGPDPLWRDVLNRHQSRPFHVMLGGGDQIYNDAAMRDAQLFREWLQTKNPEHKHRAEFTLDMQAELEKFYMDRYAMWFSQGLFAMANSQIPMVNIFDDHDIIDGYGSYPHHFMKSPVFTGLGNIAFKYYMLFQHQSTVAETHREEPSWILGASRGPYINEFSRSVYMRLGRKVALLGVDCRTERMRDEILSEESYDIIFDRCRSEIIQGETKHLIVLLGVPIAYPRLNFLENILTSRVMDPIKALGRTGMLGGFVNKFDGGVEILDDLDDHWTAKHHKAERNWFIQELQELAAERSVRIIILGGDVHLGAVGQFYTPKRFGLSKDKDHRYMPNVVSSAIVNTPPPTMMADVLNKRNKVHHLDDETDEDLIPMFDKDVDGSKRNNNHLLPRRNYCTIREYVPGSTPPPSPRLGPVTPAMDDDDDTPEGDERIGRDRRFPPGSMKRTMSLTGGPMKIVRRISNSKRGGRNASVFDSRPATSQQDSAPSPAFGQVRRSASLSAARPGWQFNPDSDDPSQRPSFLRRPTNLSVKDAKRAAAKGGPDANMEGNEAGHVNLEHGLDIALNMEIDQRDPGGSTVPYRLLVPALWYEGDGDLNTLDFKKKKLGFLQRLRSGRRRGHEVGDNGRSRSPTPSPPPTAGRDGYPTNDRYASKFVSPGSKPTVNQTGNPAGRHDEDDDDSLEITPENSPSHKRGYGLFPPPIGTNTEQSPPTTTDRRPATFGKTNPYPESGYRRTSDPISPAQTRGKPARHEPQQYDSEGSLTPSDESFDDPRPQPRPNTKQRWPSKAEQLLGMREHENEKPAGDNVKSVSFHDVGDGDGDGNANGKRKKSWQIWK